LYVDASAITQAGARLKSGGIRNVPNRAATGKHLIHQSLSFSIAVLALTADPVWGQKTAQKTEILADKIGQKIDQQT
jgi:hypothetical protein